MNLVVIIIGIIQGLTEFLPISSTMHAIVITKLFNINVNNFLYISLFGLGTTLASILYYKRTIIRIFYGTIDLLQVKSTGAAWFSYKMIIITMLGITICTIAYYINNIKITNILLMAIIQIIFGIILYLSDITNNINKQDISIKHAALLGLSNGLGVITGASRLGVNISLLRYFGYPRLITYRLSIISQIPIAICTFSLAIYVNLDKCLINTIIIGNIISFTIGYICLVYIEKLIDKITFAPIALYRIIMGVMLLLW